MKRILAGAFAVGVFAVAVNLASAAPAHAQALSAVPPGAVGLSGERLDDLSAVLAGHVQTGRLPGAVALVAREGRTAYLEAFGHRDRETGDPLEVDDIFRIASQTKAVVSVAIMMLQEQGKLLISRPLGVYLPAFRETTVAIPGDGDAYEVVEARRPVTIRDLLTHTAGIGYGGGIAADRWEEAGIQGWYFADREEPIAATVERMAALPFDAHPGERFVYGYSTDILGAVVEAVSGLPLDDFLRIRIFEPLGMADTHFYLPPAKADRLSVVYSSGEEGLERAPDPGRMVGQGAYLEGPRTSFSGGAGLLSTARDYARFLQMMLNGGELDRVRILSPKTVELMTVNHVGDLLEEGAPGTGFGLGFQVVEDLGERGAPGSVGEYGWGGAYHSVYWVDPVEELVVVYFTQVIPARRVQDHAELRAVVYGAIVDSRARTPARRR